jgi:hypothetical protein
MITHVVLMKFKPENKAQHMDQAREQLLAMLGHVDSLRAIEVGANLLPSDRALDLALITRFDDLAGLAAYTTHPVHVAVKSFLQTVLEISYVVDYDARGRGTSSGS